jgi:hypothetical protein
MELFEMSAQREGIRWRKEKKKKKKNSTILHNLGCALQKQGFVGGHLVKHDLLDAGFAASVEKRKERLGYWQEEQRIFAFVNPSTKFAACCPSPHRFPAGTFLRHSCQCV